eukprot:4855309-Prymnesium_polylepis.1
MPSVGVAHQGLLELHTVVCPCCRCSGGVVVEEKVCMHAVRREDRWGGRSVAVLVGSCAEATPEV